MTDQELIERLRDFDPHLHELEVIDEAADRIEELLKELNISRMASVVMDNSVDELETKLTKAADMMRSMIMMIQHAIGFENDVFIEPDTGRKLSDATTMLAELEGGGEHHEKQVG